MHPDAWGSPAGDNPDDNADAERDSHPQGHGTVGPRRRLMLRALFQRLMNRHEEVEQQIADAQSAEAVEARPLREPDVEELAAGAMCRICFEAAGGQLVAPCACTGTQRWVHVECLRRWQRSVAREPDRARKCMTCTATLALPPLPPAAPPVREGTLLVAAPELSGMFAASVVLICRVDPGGVHGFILNQPRRNLNPRASSAYHALMPRAIVGGAHHSAHHRARPACVSHLPGLT